MPVTFDFSHQGHALVTLYVQFLRSDWSKFDRWAHAENLCSILNLVYFDSWGWQSCLSTCDVFYCLFPLDVQNEIQLLSRVFSYSWLRCLLVFWLRDASLVKVGNSISDGIVFVFRLAWCVLKRVQNSQAILASLTLRTESPSIFLDESGRGRNLCRHPRQSTLSMLQIQIFLRRQSNRYRNIHCVCQQM